MCPPPSNEISSLNDICLSLWAGLYWQSDGQASNIQSISKGQNQARPFFNSDIHSEEYTITTSVSCRLVPRRRFWHTWSYKHYVATLQAFQRQVQECLTQLELINKQYRRLARENRTDSSCRLRQMVHDGNRRWDILQRRVAAILRRLKVMI